MIHIAQLICPKRHPIMAIAYDGNSHDFTWAVGEIQTAFTEAVRQGLFESSCRLCGSKVLHIEVATTRFTSIKQAEPHIAALLGTSVLTRSVAAAPDRN